ncbi:hypothetical protein RB195_025526 [Necator americanus]|uniref:Matrix-remodeling-associated protein 7 helical domain-containing protein n=1 Tax=Necator americanus TaxID=51031 RepID=A0ABR1EUZ5_NECAM
MNDLHNAQLHGGSFSDVAKGTVVQNTTRALTQSKMRPHEMFWEQLWEYIGKYGLTMVVVTVSSGFLIGYFLHYIMNIRPLKKRMNIDKRIQEAEEEESKLENRENSDTFEDDPVEKDQKQVGVVKGMMNVKVLASLRRKPLKENTRIEPWETKREERKKPIFEDRVQNGTNSDIEESDNLVVTQNSGKKRSQSLQEVAILLEADVVPDVNTRGEKANFPLQIGEPELAGTLEISVEPTIIFARKFVEVSEDMIESKRHVAWCSCNCSLSDRDLLHTLGKLHGKLATAQLRAKTRKMQADMTAEERDDEARTKAKQLESIMSLVMQNQEKFGMTSEDDIKEQLNMYNF